MSGMHLLILEDDPEYGNVLQDMVATYPGSTGLIVDVISSVSTLEALIASGVRIDIFMTDINLGKNKPSGIEVVRRYFANSRKTQIVYISGYVEYCTPVYQTDHTYFLLKPVKQSDLNAALDKAIANLRGSVSSPVALQHGATVTMVDPADIEYIESDRRKVRVFTASGRMYETYATLGDMLGMLPDSFVQCHKSYLVNMAAIGELQPDKAIVHSGAEIPVSQRQRRSVREAFCNFIGFAN